MEVIKLKENKDGSATVTLEMTAEEERLLIQFAVITLLKNLIKEKEEKR